jgi:uncharacterized membrane protein YwzB
MLTLLLWVIVLGIVAWMLQGIQMDESYKRVATGILLIILVVVLFRAVLGGDLGIPSLK